MHKEFEYEDNGLVYIKSEKNGKNYFTSRNYYDQLKKVIIKENIIEELNNLKNKNKNKIFVIKTKIKILKKMIYLLPIIIILLNGLLFLSLELTITICLILTILSEIIITKQIKKYQKKISEIYFENVCISKLINKENKQIKILNENKTISKEINKESVIISDKKEKREVLIELKCLILYNQNRDRYYYYYKNNKLKEELRKLYDDTVTCRIYEMVDEDYKINNIKYKKNVI